MFIKYCFLVFQLKLEEVDFYVKDNRFVYKMDDYEVEQLIIRRGQIFDVIVIFNREYIFDIDIVVLQFVIGWQLKEFYVYYSVFIFIFKLVFKDFGYYFYCKVNEVDKLWKNYFKLNVRF